MPCGRCWTAVGRSSSPARPPASTAKARTSRRTAARRPGPKAWLGRGRLRTPTPGSASNTVVPGYTETPLVTAISTDATDRAAMISRIPMGRPGVAADVEGIMVYLASDESGYATGATFVVDGGMTTL